MAHVPLIANGSPVNTQHKYLDPSLCAVLSASIKGTLHSRGDSDFEAYSKIFNGDVIVLSSVLVRPFDTEDVSNVVRFCARHSLSLSVKAGGYGTHGQAVQGDIIVDISLLNDIQIEPVNSQGTFTRLRDMPSSKHTGKRRDGPLSRGIPLSTSLPPGKRSADEAFHTFGGSAISSQNAASASGNGFVSNGQDNPHPTTRRKIWPDGGTPFIPPHPSSFSDPFFVGEYLKASSIRLFTAGEDIGSRQGSSVISPGKAADDTSHHSNGLGPNLSSRSNEGPDISTSVASSDSHIKPSTSSDPFEYMSADHVSNNNGSSSWSHNTDTITSSQARFTSAALSMDPSLQTGHYAPTRVIPSVSHAYITFGAGAKQKDIDSHSAAHPLPATSLSSGEACFTPYHVPLSAHPVGSSTMLLGGFGFLSRLHGLSMDNLVEAEVVLADGSIVFTSEDENADLFWALRAAGPAFGIVTRYKAKAYPVPVVFAGNLIYKFRKATAASLIKHFRDCVKNVPRELYANVILTAGPQGDALVVIQICYVGTQEQGIEFLQAITSWDGEQCLLNEVLEKSFLNQQDSLAKLLNGKPGRKWFIRSDLLNSLSDDAIHETVVRFADTPVGCTWLFELSGGKVSDERGGCLPASSRQANWTVAAFHQWELDEDDPRCVTTAEDWMKETLSPASPGGPYPSFFGIHETTERVQLTYGDNWERLCELKRKYDPTGFFRHTFWPLDEHGKPKTALVPTHTSFSPTSLRPPEV